MPKGKFLIIAFILVGLGVFLSDEIEPNVALVEVDISEKFNTK